MWGLCIIVILTIREHIRKRNMLAILILCNLELRYFIIGIKYQRQYRKWCSTDYRAILSSLSLAKCKGWEINLDRLILHFLLVTSRPAPLLSSDCSQTALRCPIQAFLPWKSLMLPNCVFLLPPQDKWEQLFILAETLEFVKLFHTHYFIWSS